MVQPINIISEKPGFLRELFDKNWTCRDNPALQGNNVRFFVDDCNVSLTCRTTNPKGINMNTYWGIDEKWAARAVEMLQELNPGRTVTCYFQAAA